MARRVQGMGWKGECRKDGAARGVWKRRGGECGGDGVSQEGVRDDVARGGMQEMG